MKKFEDKTLVDCIFQKVESHLNGLLKIELELHPVSVSDKRKIMKILQEKAVNLSYIFNNILMSELPAAGKLSITNINSNLYVLGNNIKNHIDKQNHHHHLSLVDELLLRLKENNKPIKISPFKENRDGISSYEKVFLVNTSIEEKLMILLEKLNDVKSLVDLNEFENEYHDFMYHFLKNNHNYYHQRMYKSNYADNIENKNIALSNVLSGSHNMNQNFNEFFGFLSNLNHIVKDNWVFAEPENLKYFEIENKFDIDFFFIKNLEKDTQYLNHIFSEHDLNLVSAKLLFDFLNKKYTNQLYKDICGNEDSTKYQKESEEIISYAKNMKLIYEQNLNDYSKYTSYYEQHEKDLLNEKVSKLSSDDYHDIYQEDKISEYLVFLKKCQQHLKEVYLYHQKEDFYALRLSDEELSLFDKVKKQLLQEFPELNTPLNEYSNKESLVEQEVGVIVHEDIPLSSKNIIMKKCIIERFDRIYSKEKITVAMDFGDYDDLLNMNNLPKIKAYQSACDFYFPYLSKDKNMDVKMISFALRKYNEMAFDYSFTEIYNSPNFEFYVKNNGIKQYQLSVNVSTDNPTYFSILTSCSNHHGFSQAAYDAMIEFAYENNLFVCRDLSNMSPQGQERLINKLNKAQEKFPDALLIDYFDDFDNRDAEIFGKNKDLAFPEIEKYENNSQMKVKKMNEWLFEMANDYIKNEKTYIKNYFDRFFFFEVIEKLPTLYDLDWKEQKLLNKEQYQNIKNLYDECLVQYTKTHYYLHEELMNLLSDVNEEMTYNNKKEEWKIPNHLLNDLLDEYNDNYEGFLFSESNFEKVKKFKDFYLWNVIDKTNLHISDEVQQKLKMLEKHEQEKLENNHVNLNQKNNMKIK